MLKLLDVKTAYTFLTSWGYSCTAPEQHAQDGPRESNGLMQFVLLDETGVLNHDVIVETIHLPSQPVYVAHVSIGSTVVICEDTTRYIVIWGSFEHPDALILELKHRGHGITEVMNGFENILIIPGND
jgi:hypothetical protein